MPFKINISDKGKTYKVETESEALVGKTLGEVISGNEVAPELEGYELEMTGATDIAGFPAFKEVTGEGLKRVLLKYGKGMKKTRPKGLRLRKTVRGNTISTSIVQINFIVKKEGGKKLQEIFPDQAKGKAKEGEAPAAKGETPAEAPAEKPKEEEKKEEAKEKQSEDKPQEEVKTDEKA